MAYRVTNILTTTSGNTYASAAEWIEEHGRCGTQSSLVSSGSITLASPTSVRVVKVFENEADHTSLKAEKDAEGITLSYTVSDIVKETI